MEKEGKMEGEIDMDLYSRQIGAFGLEAMGKLMKLKVLLIGLRGLGVETAKNLVLAGPGQVSLWDPTPVVLQDLASNFYLKEEHVGKISRAEGSLPKLRELNSYVKVDILEKSPEEALLEYDIVVVTELLFDLPTLTKFNEICRSRSPKPTGFIMSAIFGLYGCVFVDYGQEFLIFDKNGEEDKSYIVSHISNANPGSVTVHEDKRHNFTDGDYVTFREVQGMTELNDQPPMKVQFGGPYTINLAEINTEGMGQYTLGGIIQQVKVPEKMEFKSFKDSLADPLKSKEDMLINPDLRCFGRAEQMHIVLQGLLMFHTENKRLPELNNLEDVALVQEYANKMNGQRKEEGKFYQEELDIKLAEKVSRFARSEISPMAAFFGGIVAQEIVKYTGKYTPLQQWLHYDYFETLPEKEEGVDRTLKGSRYDDLIAIYGAQVQKKLQDLNLFMVGAGALGCEFLKGFSLMGAATGEGLFTCTDHDHIEVSNLNRQFLFNKSNVGMSKSIIACETAAKMNPGFKHRSMETKVTPETEDIFEDAFWDGLDVVIGAVDNVNARLYVDQKCVWHKKPLLESGTLGPKANTQVILPMKTQCYGDSQDPPEESYPMCTLRNFPNLIEHCIEWARHIFEGSFTDRPSDLKNYLDNRQAFLKQLASSTTSAGQLETLREVEILMKLRKEGSYKSCVQYARQKLQEFYYDNIMQLLNAFPEDAKDKEGNPFWSGPKRAPKPVVFDVKDPLNFMFVKSMANLVAFNLKIPLIVDDLQIQKMAEEATVSLFVPKLIRIATDDAELEEIKMKEEEIPMEDDEVELAKLLENMKVTQNALKAGDIVSAEFEKDDDKNFHIDFIHAAANLRARNYRIQEGDRHKIKMIAGKIIPAIATSTAMIVGCIQMELLKVIQGVDNVELYKNAYINLAISMYVFTEPSAPNEIKSKEYDQVMGGPVKAIPEGYTIWDIIEINGPMTVGELIAYMKEKYGVKITLISSGKYTVYNSYVSSAKARIEQKIEDIFQKIDEKELPKKKTSLALEVAADTIEGDVDASMPSIRYNFK